MSQVGADNDRATTLLNNGDANGALEILEKILSGGAKLTGKQKATILANKALCLEQLTLYDEAIRTIDQASAISPDASWQDVRGQIEVSMLTNQALRTAEQGDFEKAAELFSQCIERDPDGREFWLFNKGLMLNRLRKLEEATEIFEEVYRLDPQNVQVYKLLGTNMCTFKRYHEAVPVLEAAIKEDPQDIISRYNLAVSCFQLKKFAESKASYEAVLSLDPDHEMALDGLAIISAHMGSALCQKGDFAAAVPFLEQAVGRKPKETTLCNLGNCLLRLKKYNEAKQCYDQTLMISPDNQQATQGIKIAEKQVRQQKQKKEAVPFQPDYLIQLSKKGGRPDDLPSPPAGDPEKENAAQEWLEMNMDRVVEAEDKKAAGEELTSEEIELLAQAEEHKNVMATSQQNDNPAGYANAILAPAKASPDLNVGAALATLLNNTLPPPPTSSSPEDFSSWAAAISSQMMALQNAVVESANSQAHIHSELKVVSRRMDLIEGRLSKHGISALDPAADVSLGDVGEAVTSLSKRVALVESVAAGGMASGGMVPFSTSTIPGVEDTPALVEAREALAVAPVDSPAMKSAEAEVAIAAAAAVSASSKITKMREAASALPMDSPERMEIEEKLAEEMAKMTESLIAASTPQPLAEIIPENEAVVLEAEKTRISQLPEGKAKKTAKSALAEKLERKLRAQSGGGGTAMTKGDGSFWGMMESQGSRLADLEQLVTGGSGIKVMPKATDDPAAGSMPLTVSEDPAFAKFFKMLKVGLPPARVSMKMEEDGLDPMLLNDPDAISPNSKSSGEAKETELGMAATVVERIALTEAEVKRLKGKLGKIEEKVKKGIQVHPMMQPASLGSTGGFTRSKKKPAGGGQDNADMMNELKRRIEKRAKDRKRQGLTLNE